ncbi:hypothetical protein [Arenibaculum pallidiluteum]|uniref:hypothetical protein n=1 Tax=Arenibaculum pallidiluteum TaxID=2812559 RepID=UPI001A95D4B9|nr:hypothetical protein [Arenibaculum pallidiluteum]
MTVRILYEVAVSRARIWASDRKFDDRDEAVAYARWSLENPRHDGVKVLRHRVTADGPVFETVILHEEKASAKPKARIGLLNQAPACASAAELRGLDARLAIGRTLRTFLEEKAVTPTELLHGSPHGDTLRKSGMLTEAVERMAQLQSRSLKVPVQSRVARIYEFLKTIDAENREVARQRTRLPRFEPSRTADYVASVRSAVSEGLRGPALLSVLTEHLAECTVLSQKLDRTLVLLAQGLDEDFMTLVEGLLADLLDFPSVLRDLFAPSPNLGDQLVRLAEMLNGRPPDPEGQYGPRLAAVTLLVQSGRAPACASVLLERLLTEIEGAKPLDPRDGEAERQLLDQLGRALKDADGQFLGGRRAESAHADREMKLRQRMLRRLGLHDVADALPRTMGRV